jgi:phosphatidylinositol alpha-1,6-mannosyltransferase
MKILFVTNHLNANDGYSRYTIDLVHECEKAGHDVLCVVSKSSSQMEIEEKVVLKGSQRISDVFANAKRINRVIKEYKPDIVHFVVEAYALPLIVINLRGSRAVLTVHGTYAYYPSLSTSFFKRCFLVFLTKHMFRNVTSVVAVSSYTRNYLVSQLAARDKEVFENKIVVVTNAVRIPDQYESEYYATKNTHQIKQILIVAPVKPRKGILEAVRALGEYKRRFGGNFHCTVVGNVDAKVKYRKLVMSTVEKEKIGDNISFVGRVPENELERLYNEADMFMMLSRHTQGHFEGFGLVYLEANLKGVPCIGSVESGAIDAIKEGVSGYLVNPLDVHECSDRIDSILNRNSITSNDCIKWALENNTSNLYKKMFKIYGGKE